MYLNRKALLWFAAGAATSSAAALGAALAMREPEVPPYLRVAEPDAVVGRDDFRTVASFGGRMLRECGAKTFDMTSWGIDITSYAYLPLTEENAKAVDCVLKRSATEGFEVDLVFEIPPDV